MSDKQEEMGSFAPEEQKSPRQSPPPTDANAPLFKLMGEIRDAMKERTKAIKENTEAVNSLLTTLVGQTRETPMVDKPRPELNQYKEPKQLEQPNVPLPTPSEPTEVVATKVVSQLEDIKMLFPEYLEQLLTFTDEGTYVKVKPRQFLGSDNFAKIASVVRAANGEYKSAGKESHFRIPKK